MREAFRVRMERFEELERLLSDPQVVQNPALVRKYAQEHARLKPWVTRCREFARILLQLTEAREILESKEDHREIRELASSELDALQAQKVQLERELEEQLLEEDPEDDKSVILEIRAGTGGAEAALFGADLYRMYSRYAARNGWTVESLSMNATEIGGFKEAILAVEGERVFKKLKFESGVHRVQRVPETEASGRIHTSTVTVAVMPQAEDVDVQIDPKDLRVDVFRSSGPGGQSVNTADSAVRLTHMPSGLVVSCQDERSQLKNKAKAMKVMRARLLEMEHAAQNSKRTMARRAQIGSGERSEKIRTYNFPDRRVTDHRINLTSHRLEEILDGELDELITPALETERQERLREGASE